MISSVRFLPHRNTPPSRPFAINLPRIAGTVSRAYILSERSISLLWERVKEISGHKAAVCVGETLNCSSPTDWYETPHSTTTVETKRRASRCEHFLAFTSNRETSPATIYCPHYLRPLPQSATLPTLNKRTFDLTLPPLL